MHLSLPSQKNPGSTANNSRVKRIFAANCVVSRLFILFVSSSYSRYIIYIILYLERLFSEKKLFGIMNICTL